MTGLLNALSLLGLLAGAGLFVWGMHRWAERDRSERLGLGADEEEIR